MKIIKNEINLCFAATPEMIPYATVVAISVIKNMDPLYKLNIHFLYANLNNIDNDQIIFFIECANSSFDDSNVSLNFYDVKKFMYIFEGQNIGMWGKEISLSHYMYLLLPIIVKNVDKIIYLDTDTIVNCDLPLLFSIDSDEYLLAMGAPRGYEEMGDDVSNSGFIFINLKKWIEEDILTKLVNFGRKLPKSNFCDQYLLHEYFKKNNRERLLLVDKLYNTFPQLMTDISIKKIKILHFTGYEHIKPWNDMYFKQRGGFLFWKYARASSFYEYFLFNITDLRMNKLNEELSDYVRKESDIFKQLKNTIKKIIKPTK